MYTYAVENISCQKCVKRITEAIENTDPQAEVEVDIAAGQVFVESSLPAAKLQESISAAGYPAVPA